MHDSLLSEVNADIRADRMAKLWQRYRGPLFVFVAGVILVTAASSLWASHKEKRGGELLSQFTEAQALLTAGKPAEAAKRFAAVAQHTDGDLHSIARIWYARALVANGAKDEAIDVLKQTAHDATSLWSDIACLRLASLSNAEATCLAAKKESPLAAERAQWAAASAWAAGDTEQAVTILTKLAGDKTTPPVTRANAQSWLAIMEAKKAK